MRNNHVSGLPPPQIWRPPDKEKERGEQGKTLGAPENPELGGTGETNNTPVAFCWQRGLSSGLIAAVAMHRLSSPRDPLPAQIQRQIARAWLDRAKGTQ